MGYTRKRNLKKRNTKQKLKKRGGVSYHAHPLALHINNIIEKNKTNTLDNERGISRDMLGIFESSNSNISTLETQIPLNLRDTFTQILINYKIKHPEYNNRIDKILSYFAK